MTPEHDSFSSTISLYSLYYTNMEGFNFNNAPEKPKDENPFSNYQFTDAFFLKSSQEQRYLETAREFVRYLPLLDGFPGTGRYDTFEFASLDQWMIDTECSYEDPTEGKARVAYLQYNPEYKIIANQYQIVAEILADNYESTDEQNAKIRSALQVLYRIAYPELQDHSVVISRIQAAQILNTCETWEGLAYETYIKYSDQCRRISEEDYKDLHSKGITNASVLANWRAQITEVELLCKSSNPIFRNKGRRILAEIQDGLKYEPNLSYDEFEIFWNRVDYLFEVLENNK